MSDSTLHIAAAPYLRLAATPQHLRDELVITTTERAFQPRVDDLLSDWVATIATPAFKLIREREGAQESFCSIGTGVGLDALAAIETLGATKIGVTDVHAEVVAAAVANIRNNLRDPARIALQSGFGDLLAPLAAQSPRYRIIYENLPNIPIDDAEEIATARVSSSFVPPRRESVPEALKRNLLALHYVALLQARDFLAPEGSVLSLLGARVPLAVLLDMASAAGYRGEIFTYGWKVQTETEAILTGHLAQQEAGLGPYHFYRAARLAEVFADVALADSGQKALELEARLVPDQLSPAEAWSAYRRGESIGHTVAVLRSRPV
ncbi:MAG: hypothetical protein LBQ81_05385 [Zoogloeaceae bacterium]|jgi:hypothetical protein|nr:hypothetical protein [Zoogloeaceae bacterium]